MSEQASEHPKLPDIIERIDSALGLLHPSIKYGGTMTDLHLLRACKAEIERLRSPAPAEDMEARKDAAYLERNQVVAALASVFPSGTARTAIPGWSDDWHGCVYIDLPTGQVSWHFHDSHAHLFAHLPPYAGKWDGHTTDEKYARLAALPAVPAEDGLREAVKRVVAIKDWNHDEDGQARREYDDAAEGLRAALSSGRDGRKRHEL